jgi:2-keto-4-pentenoate hydratase/2-oxohepta-3-ene-1,7-dioic acid hydratase in catechol pathway
MRYLTFSAPGEAAPRLGVLEGDRVVSLPGTLVDLICAGGLKASGYQRSGSDQAYRADEIRWHAPIPRPSKNVFCVGRNYLTHIEEGARARGVEVKIPGVPVFFTKAPTAVTGPFDDIPWDRSVTQEMDWEAELGVVVGKTGRNIPRAAALDHVFGYTVINDVTARDVQKNHFQFFKGKTLDGFCPIGPVVVTADEFGHPHGKQLTLKVNGAVKQNGNTRDMIFPVDAIIASLSHGMTLEAGDIIACGTPDGCGFGRTPPEFLQDGDIMETAIEGIGTMRNRIAAHS